MAEKVNYGKKHNQPNKLPPITIVTCPQQSCSMASFFAPQDEQSFCTSSLWRFVGCSGPTTPNSCRNIFVLDRKDMMDFNDAFTAKRTLSLLVPIPAEGVCHSNIKVGKELILIFSPASGNLFCLLQNCFCRFLLFIRGIAVFSQDLLDLQSDICLDTFSLRPVDRYTIPNHL